MLEALAVSSNFSAVTAVDIIVIAITVLVISNIALPLVLKALRANNVMDNPNQRSLHTEATPRGGGLALAIGFSAGLLVSGPFIWPVWLSTLGFAVLGAWDDLRSRSAAWRLIFQGLIAITSSMGIVLSLGKPIALFALGAILLVSTVNAVNFMDGINGITALNSIVWGIAYATLFWLLDLPAYISLAAVLAFIGIAFLPWNFPNARLFLGDSGSYLIGGALGSLALVGLLAGEPIAALAPLAIYAADTGTAVIQRIRAGDKMTEAHNLHTFQQLVRGGWSHSRTTFITASFTAITAGIGLISVELGTVAQAIAILLIILTCRIYLWLPRLTKIRRDGPVEGD